jgi:hypothetical protein
MARIRVLVSFAGPTVGAPAPNDVIEVSDADAKALVSAGFATPAEDSTAKPKAKPRATRKPAKESTA